MHKNVNYIKWWKMWKRQFAKSEKVNFNYLKTSKKCKNRGGLISALKPGPVVPPGIEKVPNQAARKTQSVSFGHLSDILAFFRGGQFLSLFLSLFLVLCFVTFWWFSFSCFCHFLCFYDFVDFHVFVDLWFLIIFCHFSCVTSILITFCV